MIITRLLTVVLLFVSAIAQADEVVNAKLDELDARTQRIERVVDNQALLSLAKRIESLQREVQELRGENERLAFELNALKTRQREQFLDIDKRLHASSSVSVQDSASYDTSPSASSVSSSSTSTTTSSESTVSATIDTPIDASSTSVAVRSGTMIASTASNDAAQDYKNAFTLLKQAKYDDSIVSFTAFLQNHPESKYAANAQYWLAEANYVSKRYPQALTEFSKVVNKYPASSKVADAKLKLGFTHYELGQYEDARIELTRLRSQFPNSTVASLAQQRLERMSREGH